MNVPPQRKVESLSIILSFALLWTLGILPGNHADAFALSPEQSGSQVMGSLSGSAIACGNAFEQGVSSGYRCFMEQLVNGILMDQTTQYANAYGKRLFGEHFSFANRMTYSQMGGGFSGEVDAVLPLSALAGFVGIGGQEVNAEDGALFFQQGVTRWTDGQGLSRYDMRYGVVRRFNLSETSVSNVVGLSTFFQQNLEYGHSRVVTGFDYGGAWGRGNFNYFLPTTSWRNSLSRSGYEERALEGMELSFRFQPTSTLGLETTLTRWETQDGTGRWDNGGRMGVAWRPHTWVTIRTAWDGIGTRTPNTSASLLLSFPLGSQQPIPGWQGLGLAGGPPQNSGTMDPWRLIDNIGQIRVAERERALDDGQDVPGGLTVRFLQDSAGSGDAIRVQVSLSTPAKEDIRLLVSLVPGSGEHPAMPGEDYVDEPIEVTISQGTASSVATLQLLRNDNMTEACSLGVTVSRIGG
ncbi:MAG: inverse autotransporter beta domain-containing protein [Nitrospira sp.]|nr:inverse autotransporter beta domain-containing protein [Nitrospira sp.]